jgi:phosphoribosylaminoimidazolecarboxamide formyltransferase / IMP cyclohydrolase
MGTKSFTAKYKTIIDDNFPENMEISFKSKNGRQTLIYEKKTWVIDNIKKGLRYGENPGQESALYKLINGNLVLGETELIQAGQYLASDIELLQSGKHPGKTNITDADNALNILRYLPKTPCAVIIKHNNPCGAAKGKTLAEAYNKANLADRVAAFGGAIALNKPVDKETAELILENYAEVVVAPDYENGVIPLFQKKKNLRVMRIANMENLHNFAGKRFIDFKSLIDGGIIAQWSFVPETNTKDNLIPAQTTYKNQEYRINRLPTEQEYRDLLFGWMIECGVTSNSIIFVKDGVTIGIGTGEQDRVGVAEIARDKAYRKLADKLCWLEHKVPYNTLKNNSAKNKIDREVKQRKGDLPGSCMVSDAFFPFRDGVDVGINEGITAVIQPGGSIRDFESIRACNEADVAMVFTGQRCFKH